MKGKLGNATLTRADVVGIRARIAAGQSSTRNEANRFGVGIETIRRAVRGDTFPDVPGGTLSEVAVAVPEGREYVATPEEIEASQKKLLALMAQERARSPNGMLEELAKTSPEIAEKARAFGVGGGKEAIPSALLELGVEEPRGDLLGEV